MSVGNDDMAVGSVVLDKAGFVESKTISLHGNWRDTRQLGIKWSGEIQTLPARIKMFNVKKLRIRNS